jgi:uncharacterized protein
MKPRVLLVDGHSAIFQSQELSVLHKQRSLSGRHRLTQLLTRYADNTGIHVVVVFDGQGSHTSEEQDGIQIFYSKKNQTADAIIERLVAKYSGSHDIRVATDDHLERQTVESFGAIWLSISQLFSELQAADQDLEQRINNLRRSQK